MQTFDTFSPSFTRPADTTAYASTDLVANSVTAGSVTSLVFNIPYGRGVKIHRAGITKSGATSTNASFRLHLYKDSPTPTNGDNSTWLTTVSGYLGFIDVVLSGQTFSDESAGYGVFVNNSVFAPMFFRVDKDQLVYGLLEARAAYTPESEEVFTVSLHGESYA